MQTHPLLSSPSLYTIQKLPLSEACGHILGYEVKLSKTNGTVSVNVSTAELGGQLVCDEMQCHLNSSLKDVLSASVSAYNTHGASEPSYLSSPIIQGISCPDCHKYMESLYQD